MQQNVCSFIVSPDQIEEIFSEFTHRNPCSYKKEYKDYKKNFRSMSDNEFETDLWGGNDGKVKY